MTARYTEQTNRQRGDHSTQSQVQSLAWWQRAVFYEIAPVSFQDSQLVADHQKTSRELKVLVTSGKVRADLPSSMDNTSQRQARQAKRIRRSGLRQGLRTRAAPS
jgi:hypothetical protein